MANPNFQENKNVMKQIPKLRLLAPTLCKARRGAGACEGRERVGTALLRGG
jgi:hypothetical protein